MADPESSTSVIDAPAPAEWRTYLTDELKADPIVSGWAERAAEKDIPSLIKGMAHAQTRLGNVIPLPGKDAKPEELAGLRQRIYDAGILTAPPKTPDEYGLVQPDTPKEGAVWNQGLATKLATTLHKHGIPKAAVPDLLSLYDEAITGVDALVKTTVEEGTAVLRRELGDRYDELNEAAGRIMGAFFKTPQELMAWKASGLANDPNIMGPIMRMAPAFLSDSSFVAQIERPGGEITGEEAKAEMMKVYTDETHPHYKGFRRNDPKTSAYLKDLYEKAYGTKPVPIGSGVGVGGEKG